MSSGANPEAVKVVVRCRPLNSKEKADGRQQIVDMDTKSGQVSLRNPAADSSEAPKTFTFDAAYDANCTQEQIFEQSAKSIVNSCMQGYNGTIFAYGQTGTGKSHTMTGQPGEQAGIIPRSFAHIFEGVEGSSDTQWMVRASFLEIYNEEVRDLLSKDPKNKLDVKEHKESGVYVKGLNAFVVKSVPELQNVLAVGDKNRSTGATQMNQDSSRSHSIFSITIEGMDKNAAANSEGHIRVGKLNLVDLAGSERQSKTGATGDRLKEATKINLSLSALGNVISALVDGKSGHIPYRDSKLTRLLQDSLGGNTKTVMVANMGPADWNYDETLSTLRYANRAKNIKNKPRINEDPKDAMLREFQDEIKRLKELLEGEGGSLEAAAAAGALGTTPDGKPTIHKSIDPQTVEKMRAEMETQMRAELAQKQGMVGISEDQMAKLKEEAAIKAKEEAQRMEEERQKHASDAEKMKRKQAKIHEEAVRKQEDAEKIRLEKEALAKKLKAMEGKILKGEARGGLAEVTRKKEAELKKREEELERRRQQEEEKVRRIAEMEEAQLAAEGKYINRQEEAEQKTKKLKKLWKKYQEVNAEVDDMYKEFQREKEDLLESIRMLQDQMQLKDMVIEAFTPTEEVQKVMKRAHWDYEREVWVLERLSDMGRREMPVSKRPVSASGQKRPVSDFAKLANAMGDMNPRFRSENILNLELDMPERTTYDYVGPGVDPRVQAAINAAFADDGELLFVGNSPSATPMYNGEAVQAVDASASMGSGSRPGSARRRPDSARRSSSKPA
uniref:Kinesin-like protein n=1 Tax=Dunaliella salina TaxID=3046 RepID=F6MHJ0_DUNSA|nr:kinesin-2 motor subunit FLA8 [Dunaliella salina]